MILALDLGTSTGVTRRDGTDWAVDTWVLRGSRGEKGVALGKRLKEAVRLFRPSLICWEDAVFIPRSQAAVALRYGLEMVVQLVAEQEGVSYVALNVQSIRKHLLGHGRWTKDDVIAEVRRRTGRQLGPDACDSWAAALYAAETRLVGV